MMKTRVLYACPGIHFMRKSFAAALGAAVIAACMGATACQQKSSSAATGDGSGSTPGTPVTGRPDSQSPTTPTSLNGEAVATTAVSISWQPATDDVAVAAYDIYRNGSKVGETSATRYIDTGLATQSNHTYAVRARDAAGNTSEPSSEVSVTTLAANMSSPLAEAAAAMQPGEWRVLSTGNLLPVLSQVQQGCGATGSIFPYTEDGVWDPQTHRVYFIGSDHIYIDQCSDKMAERFISYSEATNSWSELPDPAWFANGVRHGYDHTAIDVANGVLYHFQFGDSYRGVQRYNVTTGSWLAATPDAPSRACCVGVEYFPEFTGGNSQTPGGLVMAGDRNVWVHRTVTNTWTNNLGGSGNLNFGDYHTLAEYNPVHKVVIFGGGEIYSPYQAFGTLYKLAADGTISTVATAPFGLRVNQSIVTVDPMSGDYLVFGPNGEFYVLDITTNIMSQWQLQGTTPPFSSPRRESGVSAVDLTIAVPISTYGVVMFVKHIPDNSAETKVYLYKHSQ